MGGVGEGGLKLSGFSHKLRCSFSLPYWLLSHFLCHTGCFLTPSMRSSAVTSNKTSSLKTRSLHPSFIRWIITVQNKKMTHKMKRMKMFPLTG